jgi:hypothetical protein
MQNTRTLSILVRFRFGEHGLNLSSLGSGEVAGPYEH